jgi:hypothetical protein
MVYLQIKLNVPAKHRTAAAAVYQRYRAPFLDTIPGAASKQMLVSPDDVIVLHGFDTAAHAEAYLTTSLFAQDVVTALQPLLAGAPEVRVYTVA